MSIVGTTTTLVVLTQINCGECGGTYAINETYRAQKAKEGGFWTCPYCKCSWGYGKGENARLKEQLESAKRREQWANERAESHRQNAERNGRRAAAARGQVTKIKNRIAKGECPCCRETFANLSAHMAGEHPDYAVPTDE